MTLPTDIIYPYRPEQINSEDPAQREEYMRDLIFKLTRVYQDQAQAINGDQQAFTPTVKGATTSGTGTYSHQIAWYLRQGLMVDVWFDVKWTAHTGTGNIYIEMPFKSANSLQKPWVGVLQTGNWTIGSTWPNLNVIPDTFRCEVWQSGSGVATTNQTVQGTGHLIGHVRYIGQEDV